MKVASITLDFATGPSQTFLNVEVDVAFSFMVIKAADNTHTAFSIQNLRRAVWTPAPFTQLPPLPVPHDGS